MTSEKNSLVDFSRKRTEAFVEKLRSAMAGIDREILDNDGLYPRNSGRLNVAELCRRAKVSVVSLYGAKHASVTKPEVDAWLATVRRSVPTGKKSARKKAYSQSQTWKEKYQDIATQFKNLYSIEVVRRDVKIAALKMEISKLKSQIVNQRSGSSTVVGIRAEKKARL